MRNVAVLAVNSTPGTTRLNCEACGYQWLHGDGSSDPLLNGYDRELALGHKFSGYVNPGDQYATAERGA